ncbi:hypothetical protein [Sphingobacterium daejeonense]|uniref:hypothetical protein n=1 Tax=Sphingobacterium daejeonense TaxID=371142 RepID=UPI0010C2C5F8|nr:hypothetical protein [Sphingobacterium daejeonense]VTQ00361.1 Uncharacterised protein [Sphingobacterium daejeonense]
MKKSLIILALLPLLFFGCKKGGSTDEPKPEEELYSIQFSSSIFLQQVNPMSKKAASVSVSNSSISEDDKFGKLYYLIYDSNDKLVYKNEKNVENYSPGSADFINKVELPKGNYIVLAIGSPKDVNAGNGYKNIRLEAYDYEKHLFVSDIKSIVVKQDSIYSPLSLKRMSSSLEIQTTDEKPLEVSKIVLKCKNLPESFYPFNNKQDPYSFMQLEPKFIATKTAKGYNIKTILLADRTKESTVFDIEVKMYNKDNVFLGTKDIKNVTIKENHQTKLEGALFEAFQEKDKSTSLSVKINNTFAGTVITGKF